MPSSSNLHIPQQVESVLDNELLSLMGYLLLGENIIYHGETKLYFSMILAEYKKNKNYDWLLRQRHQFPPQTPMDAFSPELKSKLIYVANHLMQQVKAHLQQSRAEQWLTVNYMQGIQTKIKRGGELLEYFKLVSRERHQEKEQVCEYLRAKNTYLKVMHTLPYEIRLRINVILTGDTVADSFLNTPELLTTIMESLFVSTDKATLKDKILQLIIPVMSQAMVDYTNILISDRVGGQVNLLIDKVFEIKEHYENMNTAWDKLNYLSKSFVDHFELTPVSPYDLIRDAVLDPINKGIYLINDAYNMFFPAVEIAKKANNNWVDTTIDTWQWGKNVIRNNYWGRALVKQLPWSASTSSIVVPKEQIKIEDGNEPVVEGKPISQYVELKRLFHYMQYFGLNGIEQFIRDYARHISNPYLKQEFIQTALAELPKHPVEMAVPTIKPSLALMALANMEPDELQANAGFYWYQLFYQLEETVSDDDIFELIKDMQGYLQAHVIQDEKLNALRQICFSKIIYQLHEKWLLPRLYERINNKSNEYFRSISRDHAREILFRLSERKGFLTPSEFEKLISSCKEEDANIFKALFDLGEVMLPDNQEKMLRSGKETMTPREKQVDVFAKSLDIFIAKPIKQLRRYYYNQVNDLVKMISQTQDPILKKQLIAKKTYLNALITYVVKMEDKLSRDEIKLTADKILKLADGRLFTEYQEKLQQYLSGSNVFLRSLKQALRTANYLDQLFADDATLLTIVLEVLVEDGTFLTIEKAQNEYTAAINENSLNLTLFPVLQDPANISDEIKNIFSQVVIRQQEKFKPFLTNKVVSLFDIVIDKAVAALVVPFGPYAAIAAPIASSILTSESMKWLIKKYILNKTVDEVVDIIVNSVQNTYSYFYGNKAAIENTPESTLMAKSLLPCLVMLGKEDCPQETAMQLIAAKCGDQAVARVYPIYVFLKEEEIDFSEPNLFKLWGSIRSTLMTAGLDADLQQWIKELFTEYCFHWGEKVAKLDNENKKRAKENRLQFMRLFKDSQFEAHFAEIPLIAELKQSFVDRLPANFTASIAKVERLPFDGIVHREQQSLQLHSYRARIKSAWHKSKIYFFGKLGLEVAGVATFAFMMTSLISPFFQSGLTAASYFGQMANTILSVGSFLSATFWIGTVVRFVFCVALEFFERRKSDGLRPIDDLRRIWAKDAEHQLTTKQKTLETLKIVGKCLGKGFIKTFVGKFGYELSVKFGKPLLDRVTTVIDRRKKVASLNKFKKLFDELRNKAAIFKGLENKNPDELRTESLAVLSAINALIQKISKNKYYQHGIFDNLITELNAIKVNVDEMTMCLLTESNSSEKILNALKANPPKFVSDEAELLPVVDFAVVQAKRNEGVLPRFENENELPLHQSLTVSVRM